MNMVPERVQELYADYEAGASLADIAVRLGVSHETARQLFIAHKLPILSPSEKATIKLTQARQEAAERQQEIIESYKAHGTLDAVEAATGLPRQVISPIVDEIPNREAYRRRGNTYVYSEEELLAHIHTARDLGGEPLSSMVYQQLAAKHGLAAYDTQLHAFGSWSDALDAAGVEGNEPRGRRIGSITAEQCIAAVAQCIREHGGRVSFSVYTRWARHHSVPSGPTVRKVVGWNPVVELALESLQEDVLS